MFSEKRSLTYRDLLRDCVVLETTADLNLPFVPPSRIFTDHRALIEDHTGDPALFLVLRGEHTDAHRFLPLLSGRKNLTVLCEEVPTEFQGAYIRTDSVRRSAAFLYRNLYFASRSLPRLVAVTGTNGKTTVSGMLYRIASAAGIPCGLIGTVETVIGERHVPSEMTTPDLRHLYETLAAQRDAGAQIVFLEASSHGLVYEKLAPLRFELGIFTNLTPDHLDFHKTMDAYGEAKKKLFALSDRGLLNADDPFADFLQKGEAVADCRFFLTSSEGRAADYTAAQVRLDRRGTAYLLEFSDGRTSLPVLCPSLGEFTVGNSLQALAAADLLGIPPESAVRTLSGFGGIAGRMEHIPLPGASFTALVDYAHTPDALERVLRSLRRWLVSDACCGKLLLVFGCGGDRDREKRPLMGGIAAKLADRIFLTEDNSRSESTGAILREIAAGIPVSKRGKVTFHLHRADAVKAALREASAGDILLLAGKGHENYIVTAEGKSAAQTDAALLRVLYEASGKDVEL